MTESFDIEHFIEHYIKNIRAMQQLTDGQIRDVMLYKIEKQPEYFEVIAEVSQKVDNKKLIRHILRDPQIPQTQKPDNEKLTGRTVA